MLNLNCMLTNGKTRIPLKYSITATHWSGKNHGWNDVLRCWNFKVQLEKNISLTSYRRVCRQETCLKWSILLHFCHFFAFRFATPVYCRLHKSIDACVIGYQLDMVIQLLSVKLRANIKLSKATQRGNVKVTLWKRFQTYGNSSDRHVHHTVTTYDTDQCTNTTHSAN